MKSSARLRRAAELARPEYDLLRSPRRQACRCAAIGVGARSPSHLKPPLVACRDATSDRASRHRANARSFPRSVPYCGGHRAQTVSDGRYAIQAMCAATHWTTAAATTSTGTVARRDRRRLQRGDHRLLDGVGGEDQPDQRAQQPWSLRARPKQSRSKYTVQRCQAQAMTLAIAAFTADVGVGDGELDADQATLDQAPEKRRPERFVSVSPMSMERISRR